MYIMINKYPGSYISIFPPSSLKLSNLQYLPWLVSTIKNKQDQFFLSCHKVHNQSMPLQYQNYLKTNKEESWTYRQGLEGHDNLKGCDASN